MPLGFGSLCVLAKKQSANGCHNLKTRISALGVALWGLGGLCTPGAGQKLWGFAHDLRISRTHPKQ